MPRIKEVHVSKIRPNPFRDIENYPFDEAKLERLMDSIRQTGAWPNIVVRATPDHRWELAYGHHRLEALRRLGIETLHVVEEELSDDRMLQMMANENSEEYGHDFALGVMNAVDAVVKAYAEGKIELEKPEAKSREDGTRYAPSFVPGVVTDSEPHPYNTVTLAKYLGWVAAKAEVKSGVQASQRVRIALSALELIEKGVLKRSQLRGLGVVQARELITLTQRKMYQEAGKLDIQRQAVAEAAKAAAKAGDKTKLAKLEEKLSEVEAHAEKVVKQAGQAAAATVQQYFKESKSMAPAIERAAAELGVEKKAKPAAALPRKVDLEAVDRFASRLDAMLLDDDGPWLRILEMSKETRAKKAFLQLVESLNNLSARAKARAKELEKANG